MASSLSDIRAELIAAMSNNTPGLAATDELCATCVGLAGVDGAALSVVYRGASRGTFGSSSEASRRLDEYQFTFGEGPCLDAVATREAVLVPNLDSPRERRWPLLRGALLDDGVRGVFALPVMVTSVCVGALDLFRSAPGPLEGDDLAVALLAAELATAPLLDLIADAVGVGAHGEDLFESVASGPEHAAELDRVEVHQATGMLIAALDVDATEALVRLRAHAITTGQTASQVARAIVERRLMLETDGRAGAREGSP
ncbi:ANTAR domain-containing protein [Nocardioides sp. cx-173]|uniref:ANTAR domain-containing protein n=1 Tax=Nocardioides sp. cx-173 TaxID=2898796 RepID=UPI001E647E34|nr:ANTAR domain-containing protein [Nocardioides sp. cx-173]MCD4525008.1 ANTAR domain-containing protein [Nocardioides sp. cx-173]UGB40284.1 ANTAR domain-containing protein [Nocardioides sp. cx-173]